MSLISAAVCPHPPLLVPELAAGAAIELDDLRTACDLAVRTLDGADKLVVVGGAGRSAVYGGSAAGSLVPYGVAISVGDGPPELPLSLTIGRWLLERARLTADVFRAIAFDTSPEECAKLGARLADDNDRVALLVMGDGPACLGTQAPGYLDPRAAPYDIGIGRALGLGDDSLLAGLDPRESGELRVAGRAAWQVLAGAAEKANIKAELLYAAAPYGVAYYVATWDGGPPAVGGPPSPWVNG